MLLDHGVETESVLVFSREGHLHTGNGHKVSKHTAITYLSFSPDGRELLANLGNEQIYLFDVTKKHAIRYFSVPNVFNIPNGGEFKHLDFFLVLMRFLKFSFFFLALFL